MTHRKRVVVAKWVIFSCTLATLLSSSEAAQTVSTTQQILQGLQGTRVVSGRVVVEGPPVQEQRTPAVALPSRPADTLPAQISDAEFWRMISELSEPEGNYPYDNFLSNELRQQVVIPALTRATRPGEVYIGVGPEQNFTYAAALKARMAFVLDIRRQNMLELLLYKALFELSADRADFVSRLFSRKRPTGLDEKTSATALFASYEKAGRDADLYLENRQEISGVLKKHGFAISSDDTLKIEYVYQAFYRGGPAMNSNSGPGPATGTPSYIDLMTMTDAAGHNWSYLATEESYRHVRQMHQKNLFVPLVGDFAGARTIRGIAQYLSEHHANVSAFYASNVESYLNERQTRDFYSNLLALPTDSTTMVIRFVDYMHNTELPAWARGGSFMQVVSPMNDLTRLQRGGTTPAYHDLLRLISDPAPGSIIPRFALSMNQGAGLRITVSIEPQPNGVFRVLVPSGSLLVNNAVDLPPGYVMKSITSGSTDLTKEPLGVAGTNELVITLQRN